MISKPNFFSVFACLFLLFVAAVELFANVSGSISGYVRDPGRLPVPSAVVKATEMDNGVVRSVRTGPSGAFTFPVLAPGRYVIRCFAPGFAASQIDSVILNEDQALHLDVSLQLESNRQSIEVRGTQAQVERESTQAGEVLTANTITALPLNGRSYTDLMALQPGVSPISAGTLPGSITLRGSVHTGNVSISGSRESANAFEVGGAEVEEPRLNGTAIVPDLDSIAEFRIVTAGADAEYGHYSGAVVSAVTKSGSNEFHGTGFEFLRNQDLDARNFFASERARFQRNEFGGVLGGPVKRNRVFFFIDYQEIRENRGLETGEVLVPTEAERSGDFSDSAATALTGSVSSSGFASYLTERLEYPVAAREPYYFVSCSSTASCVFPNGVIPQTAISAPAKSLLSSIPMPTSVDVYTSSANNNRLRNGIGAFRLDLNSDKNMLQFYGSDDRSSLWKQFGTNNIPGYPTTDTIVARHAKLGYTRIIAADAVNEAHFSVTRYVVNTDAPDAGTGAGTLGRLGFAPASSGGLAAAVPALEGVPPITFNDFSIGTPQFSYNAFETTWQVRDDFSLVRGKHALKFGANTESTRFVDRFPLLFGNGAFSFSGAETGNDLADFLIGAPTTFTQQSNVDADERKPYFGVYGEDSWRISHHLTVNAGLRWEYVPAFSEESGQKATFVAGQQSTVFPNAPAGILYPVDHLPGFGTIPRSISRSPLDNFGPRIGLAYSPSFSNGIGRIFGAPGTTSIRLSYGIYYGTIEGIGAYFGDPPVPFTTLYVAASPPYFAQPYVDRATGTLHADPFLNNTRWSDKNVDFSTFEPIIGVPAASVHNVTPYSEKYSVSIERALRDKVLFRVAYTGAQGHHLQATLPNNPGNPQQCLALSNPTNLDPSSPVCGPFGEDTIYTTSDGRVLSGTRAPFGGPNFGDNSDVTTIANSSYNALQTSLHWATNQFTFLAAYTYSKSLDDSSAFDDAPLNPFNYRLSRSLSAFDLAQDLVLSYVYDFKSWRRPRWDKLVSGWKLSGITRFASGVPVPLYENDDRSLLGLLGSGIGIFVPIDEPNYTGRAITFSNPRSGRPYFDTTGFSAEPLGQLGTANRRFIHGPGINNFDVALLKDTMIGERVNMELRFEFFNALNHAQFQNPSGNFSDTANFGVVRAARDPRIGQVAMKLTF